MFAATVHLQLSPGIEAPREAPESPGFQADCSLSLLCNNNTKS